MNQRKLTIQSGKYEEAQRRVGHIVTGADASSNACHVMTHPSKFPILKVAEVALSPEVFGQGIADPSTAPLTEFLT